METRGSNNALLVTKKTSNEDQYYFKKVAKAKTDDPKVTGSLDVRINRK
jgi:hypothetical protein